MTTAENTETTTIDTDERVRLESAAYRLLAQINHCQLQLTEINKRIEEIARG